MAWHCARYIHYPCFPMFCIKSPQVDTCKCHMVRAMMHSLRFCFPARSPVLDYLHLFPPSFPVFCLIPPGRSLGFGDVFFVFVPSRHTMSCRIMLGLIKCVHLMRTFDRAIIEKSISLAVLAACLPPLVADGPVLRLVFLRPGR